MKFEDDWMAGELLDMRLARAVPKARKILAGWSHEDVVDLYAPRRPRRHLPEPIPEQEALGVIDP